MQQASILLCTPDSQRYTVSGKESRRRHISKKSFTLSLRTISRKYVQGESLISRTLVLSLIGKLVLTGSSSLATPGHAAREFNIKELPAEETKIPIRVMMAAKTSTHSSSIPQFVLHKYWTFSEAAFSLAKTISSVKRIKQDFASFTDCLRQAKALLFKESIKETDNLLSQGCLQSYNVQTRD